MNGTPDQPANSKHLRYWLAAFAAAALIVVLLFIFWPRPELNIREFIAGQLGVEADSLLFVNLPPGGYRLPGAILLREGIVPWGKLEVQDDDFTRGQRTSNSARVEQSSVATGSLGGNARFEELLRQTFDVVAEKSGRVVIELSLQGNSVELTDLPTRASQSAALRSISENDEDAFIVFRAWEGTLTLRIRQERGVSLAVLDSIDETIDSLATTLGAGVRFEGRTDTRTESELILAETDVFAFEAYDAASLFERAAAIPVTQRLVELDPDRAIETVIRLDPTVITPEELTETLRVIGPEADDAVIRVMRSGDAETMERGRVILERVPMEYRPPLAPGLGTALTDPDPTVRAFSVLGAADATDNQRLPFLSAALEADDPVVRFLASETLVGIGSPAATGILRAATSDTVDAVALSANTALFATAAPTGAEVDFARSTMRTGAVDDQRAAIRWLRLRDLPADSTLALYVQGLASPDANVRAESLRGLAALGDDANTAVPSVRLLLQDADPRIRDLAQRTLMRIGG